MIPFTITIRKLTPPQSAVSFNANMVQKVIVTGAQQKIAFNLFDKMSQNPDFFQKILLSTIVIRQLYKMGSYALASLSSDDMPKDQRHLSASIYGVRGIFQAAVSLFLGDHLNKHSDQWANKLFKPLRSDPEVFKFAKLGFRTFLTVGVSGVLGMKFVAAFITTPISKWLQVKYLTDKKQ